jgi:tetratricopeptide (TPR) repeat protein
MATGMIWASKRDRTTTAGEFRQWAQKALVMGMPTVVEAQARSVLAGYSPARRADDLYLIAWQFLATALGQLGRPAEAVEELTGLIEMIASFRGSRYKTVLALRISRAAHFISLNRYDQAEADCQAVIESTRQLLPRADADFLRFSAIGQRINMLSKRRLLAEAESLARQAIREAESSAVPVHVLVRMRCALALILLAQGQHEEVERMLHGLRPEDPQQMVEVRARLVIAQRGLGKLAEAETTARETVTEGTPAQSQAALVTLTAGTMLGTILSWQGKFDEAAHQLHANAAAWAEHFGDGHPRTVTARAALAGVNRAVCQVATRELTGRTKSALAMGTPAAVEADARSVMAAHADAGQASEPYVSAWLFLTSALGHLGRHAEAAEEATRLIDAVLPLRGNKHAIVIAARIGRAIQFTCLARYDEAEADARVAIQDAHAATDTLWFGAVGAHATVLNGRGLHAQAEALARQAIAEAGSSTTAAGVPLALGCTLAVSLNAQQRHAEAERILRDLRPERPSSVVAVRTTLASAQLGLGKLTDAAAGAGAAIAEGTRVLSPVHYMTLIAGTLLGRILARQGMLDAAERQLRENAAAWAEHFGDGHPRTITARAELAQIGR